MKKGIKRFITVRRLNKIEKHLIRQVFSLLLSVRLRMILSSFPSVLGWVRKKTPTVAMTQISNPERLAWMIESTGNAFPHLLMCLPRALAGFIIFRRCGWNVTLKIGTRRRRSDLPIEAHAWLEYGGEIIIGRIAGMEKYAVFESLQGQYI